MTGFNDRLYNLLPAAVRIGDFAVEGQPLRSMLSVISEQVEFIECDIAQLYDNWFIETCQDWVVPYIGDLIGYQVLHEAGEPMPEATPSVRALDRILIPRQDVANTIRVRRRKGTLAALVALARDVAGWPAVAVEFDRLASLSQPLNDLRVARGRTVDVRLVSAIDDIRGPYDIAARTQDLRGAGAPSPTGALPTSGVGVFVPRYRSYPVSSCEAVWVPDTGDHCFRFSALGDDGPLFAAPRSPAAAGETVLPLALTHHDVNQDAHYGVGKSLAIWTRGEDEKAKLRLVPQHEIVPANLSHWRHEPQPGTVAVDALLGRISFPPARVPNRVIVAYHYGFTFEIGAGEYPRTLVAPPAAPLTGVATGNAVTFGGTCMAGIEVSLDFDTESATYTTTQTDTPTSVATAVAAAANTLGIPGVTAVAADQIVTVANATSLNVRFPYRLYRVARSDEESHDGLARALERWADERPARAIIEFGDSEIYDEDELDIGLDQGQYLQIRAASGARPVIRVTDWRAGAPDPVRIRGGASTTVVLDGLLIAERGLRLSGELSQLIVSHSTLVPGWSRASHRPRHGATEPSIAIDDAPTALKIERSIVGPIHVKRAERTENPTAIRIVDAIVDAGEHGEAIASPDAHAANAHLRVARSTVFGKIQVHALELAENTIFTAKIDVTDRQHGCMRFCYVPGKSRTPQRYECQPVETSEFPVAFISRRYGDPGYARLADDAPATIKAGADDRSEMGAFHDLFLPQRTTNLQTRLAEYVPAGVVPSIIFVS